jgi:bifunctional DNase/RNase
VIKVIELTVVGVRVEVPSNQPLVLLREVDGERFLPIWIGPWEANAIAMALQGLEPPRPLTHDLMKEMLETLGVTVNQVVVTELREGTFYAVIDMSHNSERIEISSRPSDAIALAVRMGVRIFAEEEVLDAAAVRIPEEDQEEEIEKFRSFLDQVTPEDFK